MKQKGGNHGWQAMKKTEKTSLLMAAFCNEFPTHNHANPEEDKLMFACTSDLLLGGFNMFQPLWKISVKKGTFPKFRGEKVKINIFETTIQSSVKSMFNPCFHSFIMFHPFLTDPRGKRVPLTDPRLWPIQWVFFFAGYPRFIEMKESWHENPKLTTKKRKEWKIDTHFVCAFLVGMVLFQDF